MLKGYVKTTRSQQSQSSSQKTSKIICKCLQCSLQLSSEGSSVDTLRSGKNISAREKDWDERLGVFESRKLGVWRRPNQRAGPTRKGVTSTLIRTLRSDDLTAAKTSLKKRIRVLSVFIAIVPTHFVKIDVGEPSRSWISKKHIQWNEEMIVAENTIYAIA